MEHIIAQLLQDFEHGRMSRRQLIQSLALTATAASAAGATAAAQVSSDGKGFKMASVNHISYTVADYKRTRDFYADLFGLKVTHDDGEHQCYLSFGDTFIIPRNARGDRKPPLVDHIAYTIADWGKDSDWDKDRVEAELKRRGLEPRPDTENSFHVKDPDGYDLQICGKGMTA